MRNKITQHFISTKQGQWLWDTRSLPSGLYLYQLRTAEGKTLRSGEFVIQNR